MENDTTGKVISAKRQWWLKVKTKPVRLHPLEGAAFPYIIKVEYTACGSVYTKHKWINAGDYVPAVGDEVRVIYDADKPKKAKILL